MSDMDELFRVPLKLKSLYIRGNGTKEANDIVLESGACISTDTYYGCFPCGAYMENTTVRNIQAAVNISGQGTIELRHYSASGDTIISETEYNSASQTTCYLKACLTDISSGCLYVNVCASSPSHVSAIWYEGDGEQRDTLVAVIICTYHREEYVLKNLKTLNQAAVDGLKVICVDNGGTLTSVPEGITLVKNRNFGGSGGYARGMLEATSCTHVWLMDDDIRFEPAIIERAMSFLKHRCRDDLRLAAGMFSFEEPTVQKEATAVFNGYTFVSNASGLDFRSKDTLLLNQINQNKNTYGGWWSLIIPVTDELPMPFFIKMDDIEHGLRCRGKYVVMNGFGVWHEAFGNKGNAWTEYYTTRNTLIIQSLYPELPNSAVKTMAIRLMKALAYGESKCMEAAIRGVEDYAAGAALFKTVDPEKRHREIMDHYRAPLAQDMDRKKMPVRAAVNILKARNWKSILLFFRSLRILKKDRFDDDWKSMGTADFWKEYLGIEKSKE